LTPLDSTYNSDTKPKIISDMSVPTSSLTTKQIDSVRNTLGLIEKDPNVTINLQDLVQMFFKAGVEHGKVVVTSPPATTTATTSQGQFDIPIGIASSTLEMSHNKEHHVTKSRTRETIVKQPDGSEVTHRQIDQSSEVKKEQKNMKLTQTRQEWIRKQVETRKVQLVEQSRVVLDSLAETTHFNRLVRFERSEAQVRLSASPDCLNWKNKWILDKRRPTSHDLITSPFDFLLTALKQGKVLNWLQEKKIIHDRILLGIHVPVLLSINHSERIIRTMTGDNKYLAIQAWNCTFQGTDDPLVVPTFTISLNRMIVTHFYPDASRVFMNIVDAPKQLHQLQHFLEEQQSDNEEEEDIPNDYEMDDVEEAMASMPDDHKFTFGEVMTLSKRAANTAVATITSSNNTIDTQ